ncbi:MAG: hypothetical protein RR404_04175 [Bacilli bacterium]
MEIRYTTLKQQLLEFRYSLIFAKTEEEAIIIHNQIEELKKLMIKEMREKKGKTK